MEPSSRPFVEPMQVPAQKHEQRPGVDQRGNRSAQRESAVTEAGVHEQIVESAFTSTTTMLTMTGVRLCPSA
jgi:hypothetical protein